MILRATLVIVFGGSALYYGGGARELAIAVAIAHVLAAIPALTTYPGFRWSHGSRAASLHIVSYGWPLLLSFGVTAVGQSIDRLLLAHYIGTAALGPYGVVADMLRQGFMVFGEAISLSLVTVAKSQATRGDSDAAEGTLRRAFNACLATAVFGAAFFMVFGDTLLRAVLKPEFVAPVEDLIPTFAIAFAFVTIRNFYFAQVIYFTPASYLDLLNSLLFVVISATASLFLVPLYGTHGAAIALMLSAIISCLAFVASGRRWYRLPIDATALGLMPVLALLFVLGARFLSELIANHLVALAADAVVFALLSGFAVRYFGLLQTTPAVTVGDPVTAR